MARHHAVMGTNVVEGCEYCGHPSVVQKPGNIVFEGHGAYVTIRCENCGRPNSRRIDFISSGHTEGLDRRVEEAERRHVRRV